MPDAMTADRLSPVHVTVARLYTDRPFRENGSALRRAVTALFPDMPVLHHHRADGRSDYSLPLVRYLVIDATPHLVGLGPGRQAVGLIASQIGRLVTARRSYTVTGSDFIEDGILLGTAERLASYTSRSAWLALNQANANRFKKLDSARDRTRLLEKILVGNFLSLAKGLGINITDRVMLKLIRFHWRIVRTPNPMLGFSVSYVSNMVLPEFLGLGKMVSKGFGLMRPPEQEDGPCR